MKFGVHAGLWMAKWTDEIKPILKIISDIRPPPITPISTPKIIHGKSLII